MAKFNTTDRRRVTPTTTSAVKSKSASPDARNHNDGDSFSRKRKAELFLLAVSGFSGEKVFYESAKAVDSRFATLVRELAVEHPKWTARFLRWLRTDANMRTSSIVGAANFVYARLKAGKVGGDPSNRQVVDSVILRADEPGEMLAYWHATFGRQVPNPVKRGIGDAILRLGTEFNYLKWDSEGRGFRFADILNLVHPGGDVKRSRQHFRGQWQEDLFGYVIDNAYGNTVDTPTSLEMIQKRQFLMSLSPAERRTILEDVDALAKAGMTWESLSGWLQGPMDKKAWEAIIPSMGYMALLRNLRNFDQAGVSDKVARVVAAKLADPEEVARSRQFPMRFLSAYRAAPSLRWGYPLEVALDASLDNVPELKGNTLVLVDTSSSMQDTFSDDTELKRWDAAALFGIAVARRCEFATVVTYANNSKLFPTRKGESLLKSVERFGSAGYFLGGGTYTSEAIRSNLTRAHTRVILLTDEQHHGGDPSEVVPKTVPMYTWNLAGYRTGGMPTGTANRHTFAGLSDAGLRQIPLLEAGANGEWPF